MRNPIFCKVCHPYIGLRRVSPDSKLLGRRSQVLRIYSHVLRGGLLVSLGVYEVPVLSGGRLCGYRRLLVLEIGLFNGI